MPKTTPTENEVRETFEQVFDALPNTRATADVGALVELSKDEQGRAVDRAVERFDALSATSVPDLGGREHVAFVALAAEMAYVATTGWMASWAKDGPDSFVAAISNATPITVSSPHRFCELVEESCRAAAGADEDFAAVVWPLAVPVAELMGCLEATVAPGSVVMAKRATEETRTTPPGVAIAIAANRRSKVFLLTTIAGVLLVLGLTLWLDRVQAQETAAQETAAQETADQETADQETAAHTEADQQRVLESPPDDRLSHVEDPGSHWPVLCPLRGLDGPSNSVIAVEGARFTGSSGLPVLQSSHIRLRSPQAATDLINEIRSMPARCGDFVYAPDNAPSFAGAWHEHDSAVDFAAHNGTSLRLEATTGPNGFEAGIAAFNHFVVSGSDIIHVSLVGLAGSEDLLEDLADRALAEVYPEISGSED